VGPGGRARGGGPVSGAHGRRAATGPRPPRPRERWRGLPTWREWLYWLSIAVWTCALLMGIGAWTAGELVIAVPLLVLLAAVFVGYVAAEHRTQGADRRRAERVLEWAVEHGWTFHQRDLAFHNRDLTRRAWGEPMDRGGWSAFGEVLRDEVRGRPVVSFQYLWRGGKGTSPPHRWHVVVLDLPAVLPTLSLVPEDAGSAVADRLGVRDLQVESAAFNREWLVECADERFAHAVLHPRMIELLMRPPLRGRSLRIEGASVLTWAPGPTDLDQVLPLAEALGAFADAIPRHVLEDHGRPVAAER
jgi:hypothetical protein